MQAEHDQLAVHARADGARAAHQPRADLYAQGLKQLLPPPPFLTGLHFFCWTDSNRIFCKDVSLRAFAFFSDNAEMVSNKRGRWKRFLRAERNGVLLERLNVPPLWKP